MKGIKVDLFSKNTVIFVDILSIQDSQIHPWTTTSYKCWFDSLWTNMSKPINMTLTYYGFDMYQPGSFNSASHLNMEPISWVDREHAGMDAGSMPREVTSSEPTHTCQW